MGWMGIWWLLGFAAVGLLVAALARGTFRPTGPTSESPELILKRPYAKGEIDRERSRDTDTEERR